MIRASMGSDFSQLVLAVVSPLQGLFILGLNRLSTIISPLRGLPKHDLINCGGL